MTIEPTAQDLERAKVLRESLLVYIEQHTKQRLVFRPYVDDEGKSVFPTAYIDRELARILAQARADGRAEVIGCAGNAAAAPAMATTNDVTKEATRG